ncbi:MAG TPA: hypothetical protein VMR52_01520 [Dehalococcoidia bacterium]|nr:hypothetical protein [Dehalococcoidia bacterium]
MNRYSELGSIVTRIVIVATLAMLAGLAVACGDDDDDDDDTAVATESDRFDVVRDELAQYDSVEKAQAAGWDLVEGLDHCFDNPGVGAMGFHYIDAERLDTEVDDMAPEALIYAPGEDGELRLVGVEYIVPGEPWDEENPGVLPAVMEIPFHLNSELGVYVLHAWLFHDNPAGLLQDWNPTVVCPPQA